MLDHFLVHKFLSIHFMSIQYKTFLAPCLNVDIKAWNSELALGTLNLFGCSWNSNWKSPSIPKGIGLPQPLPQCRALPLYVQRHLFTSSPPLSCSFLLLSVRHSSNSFHRRGPCWTPPPRTPLFFPPPPSCTPLSSSPQPPSRAPVSVVAPQTTKSVTFSLSRVTGLGWAWFRSGPPIGALRMVGIDEAYNLRWWMWTAHHLSIIVYLEFAHTEY